MEFKKLIKDESGLTVMQDTDECRDWINRKSQCPGCPHLFACNKLAQIYNIEREFRDGRYPEGVRDHLQFLIAGANSSEAVRAYIEFARKLYPATA